MELSDSELILLWQQGKDHVFEEIYKRYAVQMLSIALQKTGNRELSEEIVQDVFITFFRRKKSANEISCLKAYLYVVLKNKVFDIYRSALVQKRHEDHVKYFFTETDYSTLFLIETRDLEKQLAFEIDKLPPPSAVVYSN